MERGVVSARGAHEHIRAFRAHALDRRDIANLHRREERRGVPGGGHPDVASAAASRATGD